MGWSLLGEVGVSRASGLEDMGTEAVAVWGASLRGNLDTVRFHMCELPRGASAED